MATQSRNAGRLVVSWLSATEADDRAMARAAAEFAGVAAEEIRIVRACRSCASDQHGKPYVMGTRDAVHVSLSRAGELAVIAMSDAGPVGVDLELTAASQVDVATWVRKESVLKATGHGLLVDPDSVEVTAPDQAPVLLSCPAIEPLAAPAWVLSLECPDGYVGAVTVLSAVRPLSAPRAAPEG
jgi:4'-phosphopantetheinyl transferase